MLNQPLKVIMNQTGHSLLGKTLLYNQKLLLVIQNLFLAPSPPPSSLRNYVFARPPWLWLLALVI